VHASLPAVSLWRIEPPVFFSHFSGDAILNTITIRGTNYKIDIEELTLAQYRAFVLHLESVLESRDILTSSRSALAAIVPAPRNQLQQLTNAEVFFAMGEAYHCIGQLMSELSGLNHRFLALRDILPSFMNEYVEDHQ
jgi:hypothetical protein